VTTELIQGNCLEILPTMEANSIDTILTDPPYGLSFMGKNWDHGVPGVPYWTAALRVAKPGATLMAFGGTRTHHRLMCAIEDAGWVLRDVIMWVYGQGYPKSHNISKALDTAAGFVREKVPSGPPVRRMIPGATQVATGSSLKSTERLYQPGTEIPVTPEALVWDGWGTALKPAWEPIIIAMKPTDGTYAQNALKWGVAGLHIDSARVRVAENDRHEYGVTGNTPGNGGVVYSARKNIAYQQHAEGRWPANLVHDGSDTVMALFPIVNGLPAARFYYCAKASKTERNAGCEKLPLVGKVFNGQSNHSANKAPGSVEDKFSTAPMQNHHPTVKPVVLMRYLVRLSATPTGGIVLDMFTGSGTTGVATIWEDRDFKGIELDPEYITIAEARTQHAIMEYKKAYQGSLW